eukprot:748190-Hanusia_phi.AAC.2
MQETSPSGEQDVSPIGSESSRANLSERECANPSAVVDQNTNIEQWPGISGYGKDVSIMQLPSNQGEEQVAQKVAQLELQQEAAINTEQVANNVPSDVKPENTQPNQDARVIPEGPVSRPESVERRKNEVTLEQLIAIGVTDPEEQARILGTSVAAPQPSSQPDVSLPLRSERAEDDLEIRRAREVAQLMSIGVTDPVEQSQILGYDATLYWSPMPKPVESKQVKHQSNAPSTSPAAPAAARPPEDPAKMGKGQKQQEKQRVLGPAVVDMRSPIACGSFKNAYLGTMGDETILVLKHRGGGSEGNSEIQKEVAILGCISQHPHVVHCLGTFRYGDGGVCIALEWCKYGILSDWLAQKGNKVSVPQKHDIIQQICLGMRHVASCRIIHRDLAAHNILIHNENPILAKITDFGMAVRMGHPIPPPKPFAGPGLLPCRLRVFTRDVQEEVRRRK